MSRLPASRGSALVAGAMLLAAAMWLGGFPVATARADHPAYIHVVRPGETLASIAQQYYGDPRRESVLVAENGLTAQGGAAIVVGLRLVVPWVAHHQVEEGESWSQLAERFYGDARRAFLLIEANSGTAGEQPDVGAELIVPYPLRHVAAQNANLRRIAQAYFRTESTDAVRRLRRFNDMRGLRPARGQVVLIPLSDLVLSEDGKRIIEEETGARVEGGEVRDLQQQIEGQLPELREHVRRGRFTEAVSLGNNLLGAGRLTGNQIVTIQRELGTAYVALERPDLAQQALAAALGLQPDLELDVARTSPTVLRAFELAREQHANAARDVPDAPTPSPDPELGPESPPEE